MPVTKKVNNIGALRREVGTNNNDDIQVLKNLGLKFKYKEQEIGMFHEEY